MNILTKENEGIEQIQVGNPVEYVDVNFHEGKIITNSHLTKQNITFEYIDGGTIISMDLDERHHIMGLGEKAFPVEKKRTRVVHWNFDSYNYETGRDPLYVNIPFFMIISDLNTTGFYFNYTGRIEMDFGVQDYTHVKIKVHSYDFTFYMFENDSPESVLKKYFSLTGMPRHLPPWALKHQISKYSYYPEDRVEQVVNNYIRVFGENSVGSVYLDIDYMDHYKIFTCDNKKFPNMKQMIERLHSKNVKVIPIIDPGIKLDQHNESFLNGLGTYMETENGEVYTGEVWPGKCVFPDFFNSQSIEFWKKEIRKFMETGYDGLWLDMNEPVIMDNQARTFPESLVHNIDGNLVKHRELHNAYGFMEVKATYEAMKQDSSFILSRSGFAGIQKYAAVWSGDGLSTFDNMGLQIPLLCSMSVSGIPYVGCDLGGFSGYSTPELILRFYQMALFFPIYRNHKVKEGNDQELYQFNSYYIGRFSEILKLRNAFLSFLQWKAMEAEVEGKPIISPLGFNFYKEEGIFTVDDQYMVGKEILMAPIIWKSQNVRNLYLPPGRWYELESGKIFKGDILITSSGDLPIFQRENSVIIVNNKLYVFGKIEQKIYYKDEWYEIKYDGKILLLNNSEIPKDDYVDIEKQSISLKIMTL
jgi:alpha-glucosidase